MKRARNVLDLVITLFHLFEEVGALAAKAAANSELEWANSSIVRTIRILRGIKAPPVASRRRAPGDAPGALHPLRRGASVDRHWAPGP